MNEQPDSPFAPLVFELLTSDPHVVIVCVQAVAKGNSYRHATDFQQLQRQIGPGWSVSNLICFYNDSSRVGAVYGPDWTPFPIFVQITHGIFRAMLTSPDGIVSVIEEDSSKQGLRPTRGLIIPANYQWALQGITRVNCFSAYCTRVGSKKPLRLNKDAEPFAAWYEGVGTSNPPIFRQDRPS